MPIEWIKVMCNKALLQPVMDRDGRMGGGGLYRKEEKLNVIFV